MASVQICADINVDCVPDYRTNIAITGELARVTLGAGLSGCAVTTQPTAGTAGNLLWTLTGSLDSGASGTVTFTVTVQQEALPLPRREGARPIRRFAGAENLPPRCAKSTIAISAQRIRPFAGRINTTNTFLSPRPGVFMSALRRGRGRRSNI